MRFAAGFVAGVVVSVATLAAVVWSVLGDVDLD